MTISTRADDERVLSWLQAAYDGASSYHIARMDGRSDGHVRATFQRVVSDDVSFSGEPREEILSAYPWVRK